MAIILKVENEEKNYYQRVILEKSFININGIYLTTMVYKNKKDRDKEKVRKIEIQNFLKNFSDKITEISSLENDEIKQIEISKLEKAAKITDFLDSVIYTTNQTTDDNRIKLDPTDVEEAVNYGFNIEWYNDPIHIVRQDIIRVGDYNNQDFNLETFYSMLKNNIYTDQNGNVLVIDDL